jgi:hypothetical protein
LTAAAQYQEAQVQLHPGVRHLLPCSCLLMLMLGHHLTFGIHVFICHLSRYVYYIFEN